ncbi:hypothetical protein J6590_060993 [Homalodisca vitripennis]|nr:hypothetical protein J6590_060993 [Homalodisca vitripennis]
MNVDAVQDVTEHYTGLKKTSELTSSGSPELDIFAPYFALTNMWSVLSRICGQCSHEYVVSALTNMWSVLSRICGQCSHEYVVSALHEYVVSALTNMWSVLSRICGQCSHEYVVSALTNMWSVLSRICGQCSHEYGFFCLLVETEKENP